MSDVQKEGGGGGLWLVGGHWQSQKKDWQLVHPSPTHTQDGHTSLRPSTMERKENGAEQQMDGNQEEEGWWKGEKKEKTTLNHGGKKQIKAPV